MADELREYGQRQEGLLITMCRQRARSSEDLQRRRPPPGIPRPIGLGGHTRVPRHDSDTMLSIPLEVKQNVPAPYFSTLIVGAM